jgi:5-methyltetrahydrofolate--homocysteine methyltransferase
MKGSYPKILKDPVRGEEATKLFEDAQKMLKRIVDEKWITANAVIGVFPALSIDDDIEVYDETGNVTAVFHTLRQQSQKPEGQSNVALSDFIRPKALNGKTIASVEFNNPITLKTDYIGAFALTSGIGIEKHIEQFEKNHDDYSSIMLKALADRLAEAFAELLHARTRRELWGYSHDENLDVNQLIKEEYQGIRPAPGYPAQPDHTEKQTLWKLLDVEKLVGITLTESLAMYPASSVSGLYFAHPSSHYFGLGKIERDQLEDYAKRKNLPVDVMEKWLGTVLA